MKTKTQELVTAGYALAKGLDAQSAKLVKELATELAVQRVRADELNKQVVSLAVENAGLKAWAENRAASDDSFEQEQYPTLKIDWRQRHLKTLQTPASDTAIAKIKLLGVDAFAAWCDEKVEFMSTQNIHDDVHLSASQSAKRYTNQMRKEAGNA